MSEAEKRWFRVTNCENIPLREGKATEIAGRRIAIFNLGESFAAIDNRCPHRGGPLAEGMVSGSTVVCPLHAWAFHLGSGAVVNHPESSACISTYPVRVEDGVIWVELPLSQPLSSPEPIPFCERDRPVRYVVRKTPPADVRSIPQ